MFLTIAALYAAVFFGSREQVWTVAPSFSIEIILFLGLSTIVIYFFLTRHSVSPSFTQAYLVSMVLKMLSHAAFILVIILSDKAGAVANALLFLVAYLLFTALEVSFLFHRINR